MTVEDLKSRYKTGNVIKVHEAINRAIRAELIGGNEVLDGLVSLRFLHHKLRDRGMPSADKAAAALDILMEIADDMSSEIRRRYGVPDRE